jgi:hypothetical protein
MSDAQAAPAPENGVPLVAQDKFQESLGFKVQHNYSILHPSHHTNRFSLEILRISQRMKG